MYGNASGGMEETPDFHNMRRIILQALLPGTLRILACAISAQVCIDSGSPCPATFRIVSVGSLGGRWRR